MERQRQRVQRRYYRTIDSINKARALVKSLTQQHQALLARHTQKRLEEEEESPLQESEPREHAVHKYIEASTLVDQLRSEKKRLTELLEQQEKLQIRLTMLLDERHEDVCASFTTPAHLLVGLTCGLWCSV